MGQSGPSACAKMVQFPCSTWPCTRNSGGLVPDVLMGISIGLFHTPRHQLIDLASHLLDGRRVHERGCQHGNRKCLFNLDKDASCQQGIDAKILVVIRDPHSLHAEHVAPDSCKLLLGRRARRYVGSPLTAENGYHRILDGAPVFVPHYALPSGVVIAFSGLYMPL